MINDYKFSQSLEKRKMNVEKSIRKRVHAESEVLSWDPGSCAPM